MEYLLFMNRFEKDSSVFEKKLAGIGIKIKSAEGKNFVAEGNNFQDCLNLSEVAGFAKIVSSWVEFVPFNFGDMKKLSLDAMNDSARISYAVQTKFHDKSIFSTKNVYKHLNPYLKKEGFKPDETSPEVYLYIEVMRKDKQTFFRVSYFLSEWRNIPAKAAIDYSNFAVVVENPSLVDEVSDFLRLCRIFNVPLFVVTKDPEFGKILIRAKEVTKGIDFETLKVTISGDFPKGYMLVGFSKLAPKNEVGLKKFLSTVKHKIAFVFGDDKFGLTQHARDRMQIMFRLTPDLKKPLRASHALSYVLGMYSAMKV
jgi:hypothetical protein